MVLPVERTDVGDATRLLARAALVGVLAAAGAVAFQLVEHAASELLWTEGPERLLGTSAPPWWWVVGVLVAGGALVALTLRLPGGGGHRPLQSLAFDVEPRVVSSVVLAALVSLAVGAVLGPEAPLVAVGSAVGAAVAGATATADRRVLLMLCGGAAAVGPVFGNPLVVSLLLLELALLTGDRRGPAAVQRLLPPLVALAAGYLVQVGVGGWPGVGTAALQVPGLPAYERVAVVDVALTVPVAAVVAVVVLASLRLAAVLEVRVGRSAAGPAGTTGVLVAGGLAIALCALVVRWATGEPIDLVLFSGQAALPAVLALASAPVLLLVLVTKAVAYAVSAAVGFRGGIVFPAVYLGALVVATSAALLPVDVSPGLLAGGVAAAAAVSLRLPFTSVLLATLLTAGSGPAVTAPAVVGAVTALLLVAAWQRVSRPLPDVAVPPTGTGGTTT